MLQKGVDFIGKEALLKQRDEGVHRLYVQLLLNDHDPDLDPWAWGGEPILRDGIHCGQTTVSKRMGFCDFLCVNMVVILIFISCRQPDMVTHLRNLFA